MNLLTARAILHGPQLSGDLQNNGAFAESGPRRPSSGLGTVASTVRPEVPTAFRMGVLWAFASGQRTDIDPTVKQILKDTGTNHLLAISGMHIGLVSGLIFGGVRWMLWPRIAVGFGQARFYLDFLVVR